MYSNTFTHSLIIIKLISIVDAAERQHPYNSTSPVL